MPPATARRPSPNLSSRDLGFGVRLHVVRTAQFATTVCRVALARDLGTEAAATAVLGQVLQSATARHPTRQALADRLADLYGAALHAGVTKLGERQLLTATLDWPTAYVTRGSAALARGLRLLREVLAEPLTETPNGRAVLSPGLVSVEKTNHLRALMSQQNDKPAHAVRRLIETMCADEPYGVPVGGREGDVEAITPAGLFELHARLVARAPVDVFLLGDVGIREASKAVREHLMWPGRRGRSARVPSASSVRIARARPRRRVETSSVAQGRLVLGWRGAIPARSRGADAAALLAGVLGGGAYSRLFKVLREEHGLCYDASARWIRAKGILLVQAGIDGASIGAAQRVIRRLVAEVAAGVLHESAHHGLIEDERRRVEGLNDQRGGLLAWLQHALTLGLSPDPWAFFDRLAAVTPSQVRAVGRRIGLDTTFWLAPEAP